MKILTISGTRPDFIRLIPTIKKLDKYFDHILVWAGQNYDPSLSTKFFKEFKREPDYFCNTLNKSGITYMGETIIELDRIYANEMPDAVLVLGDTHASFAATYIAKRLGIPVFHMEAGNRCFDPLRVPEEVNRYMIDSVADWHLTYTQRSREHLLQEGKNPDRVIVVGNPIVEAIKDAHHFATQCTEDYVLVTIHRKENIESEGRLTKILMELENVHLNTGMKVKISLHPSLQDTMERYEISTDIDGIEFFEPSNFSEFLELEHSAKCIITDSGTVPEEAHILEVPCVLLRYSTERPELLESNAMVVCEDPAKLLDCVEIAIEEHPLVPLPIEEYHTQVSSNVVKLLMRYKQ